MAAREKDDATGFLSRWSQRKRAAEQNPPQPPVPQADEDNESPAAGENPEADSAPIDPADLPDVDSLHAGSDFTRSEEHTSELQSLMSISYAVFCLKKKQHTTNI